MSIVLNEREWAESAISNRQIGRRPVETLSRVSRYYYDEGYKKQEIRNKLDDFLIQCDPGVVLVKWADTLDRITKNVDKYPLIKLDRIDITKDELEVICSLGGKQIRRLAFTLLCIAKYWDAAKQDNNGWVNAVDKEIMKMANINTSVRRQSAMMHDLKNAGLIKFSKRVDNLNVQVKFIHNEPPSVLSITDYRNLGNQYLQYCGEPFFQCEQCGLTIKKKSNVHRYCSVCAAEMHVKKSVESVMRQRESEAYKVSNICPNKICEEFGVMQSQYLI